MPKKKKYVAKSEFRYNRNQKHITYVFEDDGKKYTAVGITHQPKTLGKIICLWHIIRRSIKQTKRT